ncbi:hypothetical protein ABV409_06310 [Flagellimonas sp. DF-77]|uniref:toxin-antitoxin system YwqK family antitoxin n=1 Tax=Flagellimonas algarum TaxID=3230298 RepID=UPI003390E9CC
MKSLAPILVLLSLVFTMYHKEYHDNGNLKAEGWKYKGVKEKYWKYYWPNGQLMAKGSYRKDQKEGYWYVYNEAGKLEMEGHFAMGEKVKWWLFYDENGKINHKCQLQDGIKNGYCLKYVDEELISAERFENGKKVKEWFSFASFKKENKLSDLK